MSLSAKQELSLIVAEPLAGFETERDGSFGIPANINGLRLGLFFEPVGSHCNIGKLERVKVWDVGRNLMFYRNLNEIAGLEAFLTEALLLTDPSTQSAFRQRFSKFFT